MKKRWRRPLITVTLILIATLGGWAVGHKGWPPDFGSALRVMSDHVHEQAQWILTPSPTSGDGARAVQFEIPEVTLPPTPCTAGQVFIPWNSDILSTHPRAYTCMPDQYWWPLCACPLGLASSCPTKLADSMISVSFLGMKTHGW
jgi:hypothetical protein